MNNRHLVHLSLTAVSFLVIGGFLGIGLGSNDKISRASQALENYPVEIAMSGHRRHDKLNVNKTRAPELNITVSRDEMLVNNYNLEIQTKNFTFAPNNVSDKHQANKGHAHVYVDGVLISRSYSPYYHIKGLKSGKHKIRVTLNTNNHMEYAIDDKTISDKEILRVD